MPSVTTNDLTNAGYIEIAAAGPLSVWSRSIEGQDDEMVIFNGTTVREFHLGRFDTIEEALRILNMRRCLEIIVPHLPLLPAELAELAAISTSLADDGPEVQIV